ncbi:hypothetical protein PARSHIK_143 [Erwinia phage vB_EamM_Parshik]|uniref:Uncharacterized protein n=1 Tax=Erwinia phage vB_EamM_Huxley TaxID=1883373 RepID=A0A1B2IDD5_9CAUD|nr:hypothetical protein BIZ81_gp141 [Erwinia phage vB_EamM_Huxley]ANZ49224.1 hypothetical protein HUXLEY_142 [Erwinia phage vB_EamM_Huxley]ANZ50052.1 hypothetical protein PARSHIK_143 [Erwinia phage vB_EamM_Parshik]
MYQLTLSNGLTVSLVQPTVEDVRKFTHNQRDARTSQTMWILSENGEFILPKFVKSERGEHLAINRFLDRMQKVGTEYGLAVCTAELPDDLVLMSDELMHLSVEYLAIIDNYCKYPNARTFIMMSNMASHLWNVHHRKKH